MATKITCAEINCKYHDDKTNRCKAKEINLSAHNVHTLYGGYRHYWTCRMFEMSEEAKEIQTALEEVQDKLFTKLGNPLPKSPNKE